MTRIGISDSFAMFIVLGIALLPALHRHTIAFASRPEKSAVAREFQSAPALGAEAVSNGVLYATGANGGASGTGGSHYLYALRTSTGRIVWRYRTRGSFDDMPFVANGTVYVASTDSYVYALSAATGRLRWKFRGDSTIVSAPTVTARVVIVSGYRSDVYGLKASSGAEVWRADLFALTGHIGSDIASDPPAVSGGTVFVSTDSGFVVALNPVNGHRRWIYSSTAGNIAGSTSVANGIVYAAAADGVIAVRASNGHKLWSYPVDNGLSASTPAVAGGRVFVGSASSRVYALNARTGAMDWTFKTSGSHGCTETYSPVVSGGIVYVPSDDFNLYALNAATGKQVWRYRAGNAVQLVDVAGRSVYVWSLDGNEYGLSASNGRKQWSYHIGGKFPGQCVQ